MRPPGPDPGTVVRSTPDSRASLRTAGTALTAPLCWGSRVVGGGGVALATPAALEAHGSAGSPTTNSTAPTSMVSPGPPPWKSTVPAKGEVISTMDLAVSTSTTTWSTATSSPRATCQITISASVSPSPMSGSRNSFAIRAIYRPIPANRGRAPVPGALSNPGSQTTHVCSAAHGSPTAGA